jgi:hypothetical protein
MAMRHKRVATHSFNGIRHDIEVDGTLEGWCSPPPGRRPEPIIIVHSDIKTKHGFVVLLHECLHAGNYNIHENKVDRMAEEIGSLLWRLGYRKNK